MAGFRGPRVLSPTNSVSYLGSTLGFNTSTIFLTKGVFKVHSTPRGFSGSRLGGTYSLTRTGNTEVRIAYGALPHGGRVPRLRRFVRGTRTYKISTFVVTSLNIFRTTGGCTPGIRHRVSARTKMAGCTTTGILCGVNTSEIILTERVPLSRVTRVHTGIPGRLRVRYFMRNTVYISFSNEYLVSDCVANESTGRNSYTRPYH